MIRGYGTPSLILYAVIEQLSTAFYRQGSRDSGDGGRNHGRRQVIGLGFLYDFIPGTDRLDIFRAGLDASRQFTVRKAVVTAVIFVHNTVARH